MYLRLKVNFQLLLHCVLLCFPYNYIISCIHCFAWNNLYLTMYCIRVILNLKGRDFMPLSEARKRANAKYTAKVYDDMKLRVKKGERNRLKAYVTVKA